MKIKIIQITLINTKIKIIRQVTAIITQIEIIIILHNNRPTPLVLVPYQEILTVIRILKLRIFKINNNNNKV